MSCITVQQKIEIQRRIAVLDSQLAAANDAYTDCLTNMAIKDYQFSGGEGSQSVSRRKPAELSQVIDRLQAQRDRLQRKLDGTGIVNMNMRRKSYIR